MKAKKRCKYCSNPIFNLGSVWAKTDQCVYCWEAENRGRELNEL